MVLILSQQFITSAGLMEGIEKFENKIYWTTLLNHLHVHGPSVTNLITLYVIIS